MKLRSFFVLALILVARPVVGQQTVVDSLAVEILGAPASIRIIGPSQAYVGDAWTYRFEVLDDLGQPTRALVDFASSDPSILEVGEVTDSTVAVTARARGNVFLRATVTRIDSIQVGFIYGPGNDEPAGTVTWDPPRMRVGGTALACAFAFSGTRLMFTSSDDCRGIAPSSPAGSPDGSRLAVDPRLHRFVGSAFGGSLVDDIARRRLLGLLGVG